MYWIALSPPHEAQRTAWGWWSLRFTPRVAALEEALLLEVAASERLWGGRKRLLRALLTEAPGLEEPTAWATGPTSLVALALLRMRQRGEPLPLREQLPDALPLDVLTAAREHLGMLERIGCRSWGGLRALPRAGLSRRFGAALVRALDIAYGEQPESHAWLELPERFDLQAELVMLATAAPQLMEAAQQLLSRLHLWLQARNLGVLALELEWTLDLRRLDGKPLPPTETLAVRTAQPTQDMAHLRRLVGEHLGRASLAAPASHLRLRSLETVPWGGFTTSLLPQDCRPGEKLHELVERLSVRLGEHNVLVPRLHADHRPERMQHWVAARQAASGAPRAGAVRMAGAGIAVNAEQGGVVGSAGLAGAASAAFALGIDTLYPPWLLPQPLPLEQRGDIVYYRGPLRRLARLYRVETGWWEEGGPALRDYFIARSEGAGLVWIFRERPGSAGEDRWYLQGLYA